MTARVLITGASGFTGRHMVAMCLDQGFRVYAIARHRPVEIPRHSSYDFVACDCTDHSDLEDALRTTGPDYVVHLVGSREEGNLAALYEQNVAAAWNVLRAVRARCRTARVLLVGSASEYGMMANTTRPVREDHLLRPVSHYGLSKFLQETLGLQSYRDSGLRVYLTRTFNLLGPGQDRGLMPSDLIARVADRARRRGRGAIATRLADPGATRDFLDVRDAVGAYWAILLRGRPGKVYNVCSGHSVQVGELARSVARLLSRRITVERDDRLAPRRSSHVRHMWGDNRRLRIETGWSARFPLEVSLKDMLSDRMFHASEP